jgi:hypothetical protein
LNGNHIQGQVAAGQILKAQQTNKHALIKMAGAQWH